MRLVQIDDDPWELGKNYPVEVGVAGHPKPALAELAALLDAVMTSEPGRGRPKRGARRAETHRAEREALRREAESQADVRPITPALPDGAPRPSPAGRRGGDRGIADHARAATSSGSGR